MFVKRLLMGIAAACLFSGVAAAGLAIREEAVEEDLIARLHHGGYVVYLRHAQRYKGPPDMLYPDSPPSAFADCTHQRDLTPYGVGQAALLGEDLRRAGVKAGLVLSHPECRARDTAVLAFGRATLDTGLFYPDYVRRQLAVTPTPGTNNVLVGGENVLREIIGFQIDMAEMAIFQPDGHGGTRLIGRLKVQDWFDD
ncbi:MAG TPA: hypothetical protein VFE34_25070 [Dongiaceae bacterium]|jgi:hypothetical protein|nr:hypothetical protein [Dongiaceae bacterium]